MKKTIASAIIVLTLLTTASQIKAAVTLWSSGDVMIGFHDSFGAITKDLIFDLGSESQLANVNLDLSSDLKTVFGNNWATSSDPILFGIAGATAGSKVLDLSVASGTPKSLGSAGNGTAASAIVAVGTRMDGNESAGSATLGVIFDTLANGTSGSWSQGTPNSLNGFGEYTGSKNSGVQMETAFSGASQSLAVYNFGLTYNSTPTLVTTLTLNSSGILSGASVVPEPSTNLLIAVSIVAIAAFYRSKFMRKA